MPTYVYKFIDSGETIEVQQSFSEDALTEAVHPSTGAVMPVKKVYLPVGVTFKGGGFYKTDSRGSKSSNGSASNGSAPNGTATNGSSSATTGAGSSSSDSSSSTSDSSGSSSESSSAAKPAAATPAAAKPAAD